MYRTVLLCFVGLKCLINPRKEDNLRLVHIDICIVISFVIVDM